MPVTYLLLLLGSLLQGALGGTLLALRGGSILGSLGDRHDVVGGFVGHVVCMDGFRPIFVTREIQCWRGKIYINGGV